MCFDKNRLWLLLYFSVESLPNNLAKTDNLFNNLRNKSYYIDNNFKHQTQNKEKLINVYFELKNLVTNEARYVLLKHKYAYQQNENKYNYYSNQLTKISKNLIIFVNKNKAVLDQFMIYIQNFDLPIDNDFFEKIYTYAKNNSPKKTISKILYMNTKFYDQKLIDANMKKMEDIKNKNLQRVDMFFKNENKTLSNEDQKIYKNFHANIEKLIYYQEKIFTSKVDFIPNFKNQYNRTIFYYEKHKSRLLEMKKGEFSSTYCNDILFSTYSIHLLIDILNKTKISLKHTLNRIENYILTNAENKLKYEIKNNNQIVKEMLQTSYFIQKNL